MPTVTLFAKAHNNSQLKVVEKFLLSALEDLNVETKICGITSRGWVQISVSGEDEKAALHYLAEEIGLCVARLEDVERFSIIKGQIVSIDKSKDRICVDIGIYSPKIIDATISLQHLQAQLLDGRKFALSEVVKLFGFCENLPLSVKISRIHKENNCIGALLSENQLSIFKNWTNSLLDRLIILGASKEEVKLALKRTKFDRDVTEIESLGLFEYAVVCKLGTDAVGLFPKIGRILRNAALTVFSPEKVLKLLYYQTAPVSW
jgi:hypothetical protein